MAKMVGRVVGEVKHAVSGIKVEIRLYKKELLFYADYAGTRFQNTDSKALNRQVLEYINQTYSLTWIPAIQVKETTPFAEQHHTQADYMGLAISRFYYAYTANRWLRQENWNYYNLPSTDKTKVTGRAWTWMPPRYGDKPFEPPCEWVKTHDVQNIYYLPYSDEVWEGLLEMIRTLARAKLRLREIVGGSEAGMEQLAAVGAEIMKALPATTGEGD